jgi:hypothetical protein
MGLPTTPPGWDGEQRGEPGIHGLARVRKWDAVTSAEAPGLPGNEVHFVALPDGTVIADEEVPEGSIRPLLQALGPMLDPPYRAEAVRRERGWAVGGRRIEVVREPTVGGQEAQLVVTADERTLTVDGEEAPGLAPSFRALGERHGREYVVDAVRLAGDLWEAAVSPL